MKLICVCGTLCLLFCCFYGHQMTLQARKAKSNRLSGRTRGDMRLKGSIDDCSGYRMSFEVSGCGFLLPGTCGRFCQHRLIYGASLLTSKMKLDRLSELRWEWRCFRGIAFFSLFFSNTVMRLLSRGRGGGGMIRSMEARRHRHRQRRLARWCERGRRRS
jgi:hypothetical protein